MTGKINAFTPLWLAWGVIFLAIEITAVRLRHKHPGGTLSSLVWRFSSRDHKVRRGIFIALWAALSGHFIFNWF
jgi:hypothetical protein